MKPAVDIYTWRPLRRDEVSAVWNIDRSETVEAVYRLIGGTLVLMPERQDVRGWPAGDESHYAPILAACHDAGGWLHGVFDGATLIAAAVLDGRFVATGDARLQLCFLHVGQPFRGRGLGARLFRLAAAEARRRGARGLYISATPSAHTIDFYRRLGCTPLADPDPALLAEEPDDIHLGFDLAERRRD
jgi:predicted N-acetyltransferase YhbS